MWRGPRIRIGVHYASAESGINVELDPIQKSYDYYGTPVNTAARFESLGASGQILMSGAFKQACPGLDEAHGMKVHLLGSVNVKVCPRTPPPLL